MTSYQLVLAMKTLASAALIFASGFTYASDCPPYPVQENTSTSGTAEVSAVNAAVAKIGKVSGPGVRLEGQRQTSEVLSKYPDASKTYITQLMLATYCRQLETDKQLTGLQRFEQLRSLQLGAESAATRAKLETKPNRSAKPSTKPSTKPEASSSQAPVQSGRDLSEWVNEQVSISLIYKPKPPTPQPGVIYGETSLQTYRLLTTWWEIFSALGPYLYQELADAVLREKFVQLISETRLNNICYSGCEIMRLSENDWQKIASKFRAEKIAAIGPSSINGTLVWSETPQTRSALRRIR